MTEGGATAILRDMPGDAAGRSLYSLQPREGDALVFDHSILHTGEVLRFGTKVLLRTDVMYRLSP
jgi:hypothetical protein